MATLSSILGSTFVGDTGPPGPTIYPSAGVTISTGTEWDTSVTPGTLGNVLTSNGTTWTSAPASGGGGGSSGFEQTFLLMGA
jgi:hypothetical protein